MACAVAAAVASAAAVAEERSLVIGLASGLVQRGISHEPDAPTLLAGVDFYPAEGWSVGVSGAMLRAARRSGQSLQLVGQLSRNWPLSGAWQAQLGALHYEYPLDRSPASLRYDALRAALAYGERFSFAITASPNARAAYAYPYRTEPGGGTRGTLAYDLSARWPLVPAVAADTGLGYQDLDRLMGEGYAYGHAGLRVSWREAQLWVSYIATDGAAKRLFGSYAQDRWALSLLFQL